MNQAVEMANEVEVKESGKSTFMQRVWAKMGKEEKGFTLIELLAVLIIIAIIAVIAIPLIGNIINNSRQDADLSTARQVYDASRMYIIGEKNGAFDTTAKVTVEELQTAGYLEKTVVLPSTKNKLDTTGEVVFEKGELKSVNLKSTKGAYSAEEVLGAEPAAPAEETTP
ncbi:prepilin-type N-terminal cleavage/methylation domain-containing protein [Saccharibacillus qingshengii]|uniref:prepilin-type N-terminal cleavage/methylation domain-containing protein n=1 Tax=Saccharibacillus qingshengii TaxID=1763540 RepID=UPI001FE5C74A|nr:prepilin-type N-terminal cleavage/methylation domain-containing protein [Saccharibacillus qingshengii]